MTERCQRTYNQPVLGVITAAGAISGSYNTTNCGILSIITDDSFGLGLLY
ncbi:MAG: hypothetical protein WAU54_01910 [Chania sp.]